MSQQEVTPGEDRSEGCKERILTLLIEAEESETLRYPETFREMPVGRVASLKHAGATPKKNSQDFQIVWQLLGRKFEHHDGGFRRVEVVVTAEGGFAAAGVSVVSSTRWRIEGLTLSEAVEAVARLA